MIKKISFQDSLTGNNRPLFENDVVAMRTTNLSQPKSNCLLYFDDDRSSFVLEKLDNHQTFDLFADTTPLFIKANSPL